MKVIYESYIPKNCSTARIWPVADAVDMHIFMQVMITCAARLGKTIRVPLDHRASAGAKWRAPYLLVERAEPVEQSCCIRCGYDTTVCYSSALFSARANRSTTGSWQTINLNWCYCPMMASPRARAGCECTCARATHVRYACND